LVSVNLSHLARVIAACEWGLNIPTFFYEVCEFGSTVAQYQDSLVGHINGTRFASR
jgi:hypothetical protein